MISRIGSQGYTEGSSRIQQAGAQPSEARAQRETPKEAAPRSAAVVRISSDARALASEAGDRARPLTGAAAGGGERARPLTSSEPRATVEIEPVVAQPVPDCDVPEAAAAEATDETSATEYQAPTKDAPQVA